jgi:purine-binding chemotaxis protein CheW
MKRQKKLESGLDRLFSTAKKVLSPDSSSEEQSPIAADPLPVEPPPAAPVPPPPAPEVKTPEPTPPQTVVTPVAPPPPAPEPPPPAPAPVAPAAPAAPVKKAETPASKAEAGPAKQEQVMDDEEHLVIFVLDGQLYGINIANVEGIIKMQQITIVPRAPYSIIGVTNLRGNVLPVINLQMRLGLRPREQDSESRIVVINYNGISSGMLVDSVHSVVRINNADIEPPSPFVSTIESNFIKGIAKTEEGLVILLDLGCVLQVRANSTK